MVKTHEIQLNTKVFNQFASDKYIILKSDNIEVNDYILFKQIETIEGKTSETGLFKMTQVKNIITSEGLKDGYALVIVNNL